MKALLLRTLLGALGPLIKHILDVLVNQGTLEKAVELAKLEVARLAGNKSLDNDAKRKAAATAVKTQLGTLGMEITDSVLNLAIELAVAAVKSKFGE